MIALFGIFIVCMIVIPFILNLFLFILYIVFPTVLIMYIVNGTMQNRKHIKIKNTLDILTSQKTLDKFSREEKKRVMVLVDAYLNNYKQFKSTIKDDLLWAGVGYSLNSMGLDSAMRVGIGYTLLRKYVKPAMKRSLDGE